MLSSGLIKVIVLVLMFCRNKNIIKYKKVCRITMTMQQRLYHFDF